MRQRTIVIAPMALLLVLGGCASNWGNHATPPCVYFAVDGSDSTLHLRTRYCSLMDATVETFPPGTWVNIWRFDTDAREVYNGQPLKPQDLWRTQDQELKPPVNQQGTRPDEFLRQLLQDLPRRPEKRLALVMLWDGETVAPLTALVEQLAADPRLRAVWLVGVDSQFRAQVKSNFQALGHRLVISGLNDVPSGRETFRQLVEEKEVSHHVN